MKVQLLKKLIGYIFFVGLPFVDYYHGMTSSIFFNMEVKGARGLEKLANQMLVPSRYVFSGREVEFFTQTDGSLSCDIHQQYSYEPQFAFRTLYSIAALPLSLPLGVVLKALSYMSPTVRKRHDVVKEWIERGVIQSNNAYYASIGIDTQDYLKGEESECLHYFRHSEDLENMKEDRRALQEIVNVLNQHRILFWVDCGTCLGAYRYGGVIPWDFDVDIAILAPDFNNAFRALKKLDPSKYTIQDWSGRDFPNSYLKVYVKGSHTLIDIYHFKIDPNRKEITTIVSNEKSIFLSQAWKIRERRYKVPTAFHQVFPLKYIHFDGICVPVPNDIKGYLQARYGENLEPNYIYSEVTHQYEKDVNHPYWKLQYAH